MRGTGNRSSCTNGVVNAIVGKMGIVAADRDWSDFDWLARYIRSSHFACAGLLRADHRDHAAERKRGGFGWRVRGSGEPNGVWPARRRLISFSRHHLVRHSVHDDVTDTVCEAGAVGDNHEHRLNSRADAEASSGACENDAWRSGAGSNSAEPGSGGSAIAESAAGTERATEEVAAQASIRVRYSSLARQVLRSLQS